MTGLILLISIAFLFYLLIPGLGAFYIRSKWRVFRKAVLDASFFSTLSYADTRIDNGFVGLFRMVGRFRGADDNEMIIWIKNSQVSVRVDIGSADFYLLPTTAALRYEGKAERNDLLPQTGSLHKLTWKNVLSIDERSDFLVAGPFFIDHSRGLFRSAGKNRLLVLLFDGDPKSLMRRSIWSGRQKNEYWNVFTPGSLLVGAFSLFVVAYLLYSGKGNLNLVSVAIVLSLLPVSPLLPPGVLFFYLYSSLWDKARILRSERDLFLLPVRFYGDLEFSEDSILHLPDGELYGVTRIQSYNELGKIPGKLRTSQILSEGDISSYYAFGRAGEKDAQGVELGEIDDPLVENIILPGNPLTLSHICQKRARRLELFSMAAFLFGFFVNIILIFQGISILLK